MLAVSLQAAPSRVEVLRSTGGLPAHIAGILPRAARLPAEPTPASTSSSIAARTPSTPSPATRAQKIVEIGAEPGRVLDPSAFDIDPADGSFVVADAPLRRQRIQIFTASGGRIGGFTLPAREVAARHARQRSC